MKNIILSLLLTISYGIAVKAQDLTSKIDSLTTELNQLKHEHYYLSSIYQLNKMSLELSVLDNNLKTAVNTILIYGDENQCDIELYSVFENNYECSVELLNSQSYFFSTLKRTVTLNNLQYNFNELEIKEIEDLCSYIDMRFNQVNNSLELYKKVLTEYKKLPSRIR